MVTFTSYFRVLHFKGKTLLPLFVIVLSLFFFGKKRAAQKVTDCNKTLIETKIWINFNFVQDDANVLGGVWVGEEFKWTLIIVSKSELRLLNKDENVHKYAVRGGK